MELHYKSCQFFVGGASAGAVMALSCAYYRTPNLTNQNMIDQVFVNAIGSPAIKDVLGPIHADYYYGNVATANWPKIAGVFNMWGAIAIPKDFDGGNDNGVTEATFFQGGGSNANPPMIAFHGYKDIVFPFRDTPKQDVKFSTPPVAGQNYNAENRCLNTNDYYILEGYNAIDGASIKMCSSLNMYNILKQLNRYTELYYDCDMKHGLGSTADFGIGTSDETLVNIYMVQRAANFFQAVMNGAKTFGVTGRSVFRDCMNNRTLCSTTTDAPNCTNDPDDYEACP